MANKITRSCSALISSLVSTLRHAQTKIIPGVSARNDRRLTDFPREHSHFITDTIGSEAYEVLRERAETVTKLDWGQELARLKARAKELGL